MVFAGIIALRAIAPPFGEALPSPIIVGIPGEQLSQVTEILAQPHTGSLDRRRFIIQCILLGALSIDPIALCPVPFGSSFKHDHCAGWKLLQECLLGSHR
jgi:hypothetical protein